MKRKCRITFLLSIILLSVLLCSCRNKQDDDIYIYFTGDVHCAVTENIGYSSLSAYFKKQRKEHKYVTLVDLGDFLQDNAKNSNEDNSISSLTKGSAIIDLMNITGYDIVTIGNHEFDFGIKPLAKGLDKLNAELTLCNVKYNRNLDNPLSKAKDYIIKEYGNTKVAYIGVTTPEILYKCNEKIIKDDKGNYLFYFYEDGNGKELYNRIQSVVCKAKIEADYVVLLSHLGNDNKEGYSSEDVIKHTFGIDAVLDSHSHKKIERKVCKNPLNKDVILCSAGKSLESIGRLIIKKDGSLETFLIKGYDMYHRSLVMDDDKRITDALDKIHKDLYGLPE